MKRIASCTAAIGMAAMLALGTSTSAFADTAGGAFVYHQPNGATKTINSPLTDTCYPVSAIGETTNATKATALLYANAGCAGTPLADLQPSEAHNEVAFKSVMFVR